MLKLAGALLILISAAGLGFRMAARWRQRVRELEQLRQMVYFLKGEIVYSRAPLAEALEQAGKRSGGELGRFFEKAAEGIRQNAGESLYEIWSGAMEALENGKRETALSAEDLVQLKGLGRNLGYLDVDMQERLLLLYLEQLDLTIAGLREQQREKCRLYASMGVMGGIFLVIVLT